MPEALYSIARTYERLGKYEEANNIYQIIVTDYAGTAFALKAQLDIPKLNILSLIESGNDLAAQVAIDKLIADFNDHPALPMKLALLGDEYFYDKDYPKAIAIWKLVLNKYPGRGPKLIPYLLATSYERMRHWHTAIKYYEQSLQEYPNCKYGYRVPYRLGILYRRVKKYEEAVYWLGQQGKLYSHANTGQRALFLQGAVYQHNMKEYEKAAEVYRKYIDDHLGGESAEVAPYCLARCLKAMGRTGEAISALKDGLEKCSSPAGQEDYRRKLAELQEGGE